MTSTANGVQAGSVQDPSWQNLETTGNVVEVGSIVEASSADLADFTPTSVKVNGIACSLIP